MAKQLFFNFPQIKENEPCPCCGHVERVWRKNIVSTAAASLVRLVLIYEDEYLHLDQFTVLAKDRNFSQLYLWGLAMPKKNQDSAKRASGMWRPTKKGIDFVYKKITLPKYIITRSNQVLRFEGHQVDIINVLGQKFDYATLLMLNR